jgi:hypothetical protein
MRAGPLADPKVVRLLNEYFVPVYVSNEDYATGGPAPAAERDEKNRIYRESLKSGLSTGTVHVYLLTPEDARPFASLHVAEAAKAPTLIALLERVASERKLSPGQPVATPRPQLTPPKPPRGGLTLHLTARNLTGGGWGGPPGEDWIVFSKDELRQFAPADLSPGAQCSVPRELAIRLLTHFYPATENNDVSKNRFEAVELTGTVIAALKGRNRVRLDGRFRMEHWFYHKDDDKMVEATVVGYLDIEPQSGRVVAFRLVTDTAKYNNATFAVAVTEVE